jgi:hypothetical protein
LVSPDDEHIVLETGIELEINILKGIDASSWFFTRNFCIVHLCALKLILIPFNVFEGVTFFGVGRGSSVGIATAYGLDGRGIKSR